MPAARPTVPGLIEQLNASAPKRAANNALPIANYFRSCDLLISQAHVYRNSGNEEQLYVMLMRFASLVIETIPRHAQFAKDSPQYKRLQNHVVSVMKELEHIKASLRLRNVEQPSARTLHRPHDASLLVTSNLPEIDWGSLSPAGSVGAAGPSDSRFGAEAAEWLARSGSGAAAGPSGRGGAGAYGAAAGVGAYGAALGPAAAAATASWGSAGSSSGSFSNSGSFTAPGGGYQSAYVPASQQALDKHSLFAPRTLSGRSAAAAAPPVRPRYPGFDATPAAVDLLWAPQQQQQKQQQDASSEPSAPPEGALASLSLADRRAGGAAAGSLLDAPMAPHPSAGPSLGPQELEVLSMDAGLGHPGGTCAQGPGQGPGQQQQQQQLAVQQGGIRPLEKRQEMRDVHISVALMNDFLHYASSNTRRGIESCGILAGTLSAGDSVFRVTTLIIPKQEGTSDTVSALNEEEIYEAQFSRELYPLGWIHTHPTQTCFLSSVDVHTQCGYQTMLDEAVAIVMAPTDSRNKCGIFRLTTPGGLQLVQKCPLRGFHTHPPTATGQEVYELCGHVYLNPRTKHDVLDLR